MIKRKIIKYLGAIGLFCAGMFSASLAKAQQIVYGPPPSQMQTLYGIAPVTPLSVIQTLFLPFIILVAFIVAIVLGIRAIKRRKNEQ